MFKGTRFNPKYWSGFHVFHKLEDARKYTNSIHAGAGSVILKVKTGGIKVTGIQYFFAPFSFHSLGKSVKAKVTVAEYITLLEEVV
jgi:hypothetical protein